MRGNEKPHLNKTLRKAIMKRYRLKNKANKSKKPIDTGNSKGQCNYVVKLNRQSKEKDFLNFNKTDDPYFSNKHARGDSKITLIENEKILKSRVKKFQVKLMRILIK